MSFDLGFFSNIAGKSDEEVINCYNTINSGGVVNWNTNKDFDEFLVSLNSKYPKNQACEEDSPWSCSWVQADGYCILSLNGPKSEEANSFLGGQLMLYGLISYNPQAGVVFRGDDF